MIWKRIKIALILLPWIGWLGGCVDNTDIELGSSRAQLMVEGKIEVGKPPHVLLSQSGSFYAEQPTYVEDAEVTISDDQGNTVQLDHEGNGKYRTASMVGEAGKKYRLQVLHQEQSYEAWTTIPTLPEIEKIEVEYFNQSILKDEGYYIQIKGPENGLKSGYYRILVYDDEKLVNPLGTDDFFVAISGEEEIKKVEVPIPFETGDRLRMEVIRMDKAAYLFYQSYLLLLLNDGGLFGSPPSNPESNLSNGGLGLFQGVSTLEVLIEVAQ